MAQASVRSVAQLDRGWVLAPERYDPRRGGADAGVRLGDLVRVVGHYVAPDRAPLGRYLVLDTSDAKEGVLLPPRAKVAIPAAELGSAKKVALPGDVLISRLRPYLRQVALVDDRLVRDEGAGIACSPEFYVLRARTTESVAFLVAFLLGAPAQARLAAAQEGGHHPRVPQATLEDIVVPEDLVERRAELSAQVEGAIAAMRDGQRALAAAIRPV
jgi:hypothetical protein